MEPGPGISPQDEVDFAAIFNRADTGQAIRILNGILALAADGKSNFSRKLPDELPEAGASAVGELHTAWAALIAAAGGVPSGE